MIFSATNFTNEREFPGLFREIRVNSRQESMRACSFSIKSIFLFRFDVTPGEIACIADVPVPVDLRRIGTGRGPFIGEIDTVDRQARQVPGVDERAKIAGLPAERTCSIVGEGGRDRSIDGAAGRAAALRGRPGWSERRTGRCVGWSKRWSDWSICASWCKCGTQRGVCGRTAAIQGE